MKYQNILVTGGLGFIGSNFVNLFHSEFNIIILDKLTYAASRSNILPDTKCEVVIGDICDANLIKNIIEQHKIDAIVNFAAESHVDNSINSPKAFIDTNIIGTYTILDVIKNYYPSIRLVHVSTDEVFGSLELDTNDKFSNSSSYKPSSPYSASKAASDHLVRAWVHTYGIDAIITNCSNNYGANQHIEKLIPKTITNALEKKPITVYGNGKNVRDWIYVEDHCRGIMLALNRGIKGTSYLFGGNNEISNIEVVNIILDIIKQENSGFDYHSLITYVTDRPGHDLRYAIDNTESQLKLGFKPSVSFQEGIASTIKWYMRAYAN
ncbi:MAG: dTDP-glucose 4,6-dehydratase [Alphaproteobacteria bacterium]|nr:dTDP-glucose 4,6-dehydratase [Alphaproteobacteria bacterium]